MNESRNCGRKRIPLASCHLSDRASGHREASQQLHIVKTVTECLSCSYTSKATRFRQDISRQPVWFPLKAAGPQFVGTIFQLLMAGISRFGFHTTNGRHEYTSDRAELAALRT
jgi:hypothetical protein